MRSGKAPFLILILALTTACGSGSSGSDLVISSTTTTTSGGGGGTTSTSTTTSTTTTTTPTGANVLPITVNGSNGSLCSASSYFNEPCVSITICSPGTSTCQTIDDILLDTGDYGLRIFSGVLTVPLTPVTNGSGSIAECVQYADGSSDWGPVDMANVILGNEPAVEVPIQVIDASYATLPSGCTQPDQNPDTDGFNGELGVGLLTQDCGSTCANGPTKLYYSCSGSSCSETAVALSNQVQNPVALLPEDYNGVIVELPSVPLGGLPSVNGYLVLGIGTQSNNVPPSGVTMYTASQLGEINTDFGVHSYPSVIDTGSNGLYFTPNSTTQLPTCDTYWFCPSSTISLSTTNTGASGSPSGMVSFQIGNFVSLANSGNSVFADIGGPTPGFFDWGLPFFFGRNVYVGIDGQPALGLGTGPYWAY